MKYIFIDTETIGLPKDESLSPMVTDNWPRLVSFAYILCVTSFIKTKVIC